ncbi:MAG: SGNH/GDSL hydrolase family protein [Anaerolineae bacterium]|nr:SGNH/GDSL hydrolase family protein [Anaerolineae bacterium]
MPDPIHPLTVLFYGDSRAADWPPPDLPGFIFANRGTPGQTSTEALRRWATYGAPLHPDIVVLEIGINDLTAVSLFPEETASLVVQCQNNIRQLVSQVTTSGATVILTTVFPAGYLRLGYREFGLSEISSLVVEVNKYLTILARPQVILFDAYTLLSENGLVKGEYTLDLLHLNSAGYAALNQSLTPLLLDLAQSHRLQPKS